LILYKDRRTQREAQHAVARRTSRGATACRGQGCWFAGRTRATAWCTVRRGRIPKPGVAGSNPAGGTGQHVALFGRRSRLWLRAVLGERVTGNNPA